MKWISSFFLMKFNLCNTVFFTYWNAFLSIAKSAYLGQERFCDILVTTKSRSWHVQVSHGVYETSNHLTVFATVQWRARRSLCNLYSWHYDKLDNLPNFNLLMESKQQCMYFLKFEGSRKFNLQNLSTKPFAKVNPRET